MLFYIMCYNLYFLFVYIVCCCVRH